MLARSAEPRAAARIGGSGGDGPVRRKGAEVIDAQQVEPCELRADARHPPGEVRVLQCRPVVHRIAPQLPELGEIIRRHTAHRRGLTGRGESEQSAVRPGLDRGGPDVEGQVTEEPHSASARVFAQALPLHVERVLLALDTVHLGGELAGRRLERRRIAITQRHRPAPERCTSLRLAERLEQRVVAQPRS